MPEHIPIKKYSLIQGIPSIKYKFIIISTSLILISVISLTLSFIGMQVTQIKQQLISRGLTISNLIAYNARYGVQIGDKPILNKIIGGIYDDPDVVYCIINDSEGEIITSHNKHRSDVDEIRPYFTTKQKHHIEYNRQEEDIINFAMPVTLPNAGPQAQTSGASSEADDFFSEELEFDTEPDSPPSEQNAASLKSGTVRVIGAVQIGISLNNMKKDVRTAIGKTLIASTLILFAGIVLAFWFGTVISAPIRKVVALLRNISEGEGDLSQRIHLQSNDEVGMLAIGFNTFMDKFQEIKRISVSLNELADGGGDLTHRLNIPSQDEVGMIAKGFDRFIDKLHDIICQVADNTEKISEASQSVFDTTYKLSRDLNEMAQQAVEVAESSDVISTAISQTSHNVTQVNSLMAETEQISNAGVGVVNETRQEMDLVANAIQGSSEAVNELNRSSQKIDETIQTITEIADQTKLIAINAAIEASRVGTQGKGFTVVAEEIRRLAARVTKATKDISQRIRDIQDEAFRVVTTMHKGKEVAEKGVRLSNQSEKSLEGISSSVVNAKQRIFQITDASVKQSSSIQIISKNISGISKAARDCSDGVSKSATAMEALNSEVQELRFLVGNFKLRRR